MTDQEIVDKAVADIKVFQAEVSRNRREREAKAARFDTLVKEVMEKAKCDRTIAERYVSSIITYDFLPRTTTGEQLG